MADIQPTRIVSNPSEIEQLLTRYSGQIASDFNQEPRVGKYVDRFHNLRNGYYLKLAVRGDWKMIRFCGPAFEGTSDELLDIVVLSPHTGVDQVAGRLIEVGGEIEVVHNGRVNQSDGRGRPFLIGKENIINIDGKPFFRLGPLLGAETFDNIVAYHESRLVLGESPTPEQIADDSYQGDGGPSANGKRSGGIWEARHSPLWTAFLNWIGEVERLRLLLATQIVGSSSMGRRC